MEFGAEIDVLIFSAHDHVGKNALVGHVFEANACIPAVIPAGGRVRKNTIVEKACVDVGPSPAARAVDHPLVPSVAQPATSGNDRVPAHLAASWKSGRDASNGSAGVICRADDRSFDTQHDVIDLVLRAEMSANQPSVAVRR